MKNNFYLNVYTFLYTKNIKCISFYEYYLYEYFIFPKQQNRPKYS